MSDSDDPWVIPDEKRCAPPLTNSNSLTNSNPLTTTELKPEEYCIEPESESELKSAPTPKSEPEPEGSGSESEPKPGESTSESEPGESAPAAELVAVFKPDHIKPEEDVTDSTLTTTKPTRTTYFMIFKQGDLHPGVNKYCGDSVFNGTKTSGFIFYRDEFIPYLIDMETMLVTLVIPPEVKVTRLGAPGTFTNSVAFTATCIDVIGIRNLWCINNEIVWNKLCQRGNVCIPTMYRNKENLMYFFTNCDIKWTWKDNSMFETLLEYDPDVWKTLFVRTPNLYLSYKSKTDEMKRCMKYHMHWRIFDAGDSGDDAPDAVLLTPEIVLRKLIEQPWVFRRVKQSEQHCWAIIKHSPHNIKYVKNPTCEMVEYINSISPTLLIKIDSARVSCEMLKNSIKLIDEVDIDYYRHTTPRLRGALYTELTRRVDLNRMLNSHHSIMISLIKQIPLMQLLLNNDAKIYGSFARWLIANINNKITMSDVFEFLDISDIDIRITKRRFNIYEFHNDIRAAGGCIEFSGFDNYNTMNSAFNAVVRTTGHFLVWYPLQSGWIKYDVMIGRYRQSNDSMFTVNQSTINTDMIACNHYSDIADRTIRTLTIDYDYPAKQLMRIGKLLVHGYSIPIHQRPVLGHLFERVDREDFTNISYAGGEYNSPSIPYCDSPKRIVLTNHRLNSMSRDEFNVLPLIVRLRAWLISELDEPFRG